jgi:hypothetical protein
VVGVSFHGKSKEGNFSPLQRDEMEGKEKEKEKKKKKERGEGSRRRMRGSCLSRFQSHPLAFSRQQGFPACQQMMIQHILSAFVAVSKFHGMNMFVL